MHQTDSNTEPQRKTDRRRIILAALEKSGLGTDLFCGFLGLAPEEFSGIAAGSAVFTEEQEEKAYILFAVYPGTYSEAQLRVPQLGSVRTPEELSAAYAVSYVVWDMRKYGDAADTARQEAADAGSGEAYLSAKRRMRNAEKRVRRDSAALHRIRTDVHSCAGTGNTPENGINIISRDAGEMPYRGNSVMHPGKWMLCIMQYDWGDDDCGSLFHGPEIKYCPFCGKLLPDAFVPRGMKEDAHGNREECLIPPELMYLAAAGDGRWTPDDVLSVFRSFAVYRRNAVPVPADAAAGKTRVSALSPDFAETAASCGITPEQLAELLNRYVLYIL